MKRVSFNTIHGSMILLLQSLLLHSLNTKYNNQLFRLQPGMVSMVCVQTEDVNDWDTVTIVLGGDPGRERH